MSLSRNLSPVEQSLEEINLKALTLNRTYFSSPIAWEDEVLYFLMVDRFSDGKELNGFKDNDGNDVTPDNRQTRLFKLTDARNINRDTWFENGKTWCGGTLKGIRDKLGYLKRLGITALWISPPFKQTNGSNSYHGYGIQNFLDIDHHFGTRDDLKDLVQEAHRLGIRVILDIILNHGGNVFAYTNGEPWYTDGQQFHVKGYRLSEHDEGSLPFGEVNPDQHPEAWPNGAIWPREFQSADIWSRKGQIGDQWDWVPAFIDGDFFSLKDIDHGNGDMQLPETEILERIKRFNRNRSLKFLSDVFKFWIAFADIDGYRIDTVKHMEPGAVRYFTNVLHEFAQSIGKENFYLIGEVTGGRSHAVDIVDATGLDAGLGIDEIQDKLELLAKGLSIPGNPNTPEQAGYFDLFNNSLIDGKATHQWFGKRIVTMFDDHDQVGKDRKFRYCGQEGEEIFESLPLALALNLTTLGIPCIYYGTEQAFNGADKRTGDDKTFSDVFLRECMFGGGFGSLQSSSRHFFNEAHNIYKFISGICELRRNNPCLRRGRQYLREVSASGKADEFFYPSLIGNELRWVVGWSRIFNTTEFLCAINTDMEKPLEVFITVDSELCPPESVMTCIFSTDTLQKGQEITIQTVEGRSVLKAEVPKAGFVIFSNGR